MLILHMTGILDMFLYLSVSMPLPKLILLAATVWIAFSLKDIQQQYNLIKYELERRNE